MNRSWILVVLVGCSSVETPSSKLPQTTSGPAFYNLPHEDEPWSERWIGDALIADCRRHIQPLLEWNGIPFRPKAIELGLIEFGTDTAVHAQEARVLILRDAKEKRYYFICRDGIVQPD